MPFELVKQIRLFDATWGPDDMQPIANEWSPQIHDDDVYFLLLSSPPSQVEVVNLDIHGIPWSKVPDDAWNDADIINHYIKIGSYQAVYLRFTVSILNGRPGDSVLFLFNDPNAPSNSKRHAQVHLEVIGESSSDPFQARCSTSIQQHFVGGFKCLTAINGEVALEKLKDTTEVRFLGVMKQPGIQLRAAVDFIGGMN